MLRCCEGDDPVSPVPPYTPGGGGSGGGLSFHQIASLPAGAAGDISTSASINSFPQVLMGFDGTDWQQVAAEVNQPHVIVRRASVQTVAPSFQVDVLWDDEVEDLTSFHSPGAAELAVPVSGPGDIWGGVYQASCALTINGVSPGTWMELQASVSGNILYEVSKIASAFGQQTIEIPPITTHLDEGAAVKFSLVHNDPSSIDIYGVAGSGEVMASSASLVRLFRSSRLVR
jgi:hypothetical protein